MTTESVDVAVVGGGPAGALTGMLLAQAGRQVIVLERAPRWRWRACGVFASPAAVAALRAVGLAEGDLGRVARPVSAMRVVSGRGATFRLTYGGSGALADSPVGFDRSALDPLLLELAAAAGASVRVAATADGLRLERDRARIDVTGTEPFDIVARVVVGADGLRSRVAAAAGVVRRPPLGPRAALTFHLSEVGTARGPTVESDGRPREARMIVFDDGYVGLAPVPGGRVNVGIVLGRSWFARLRLSGGWPVAQAILARLPLPEDAALADREPLDRVAGVTPLGHAVSRRVGDSWLLVGDAAGFLDPFTGEGLHRAIVSATLAAESIDAVLGGRPGAELAAFERGMRARFATKDAVSRIVQGFLGRPALFDYTARRLAARSAVRETMGLVIGDLAPAGRVLDPRYLVSLLAP
jgi:flavin-dependent dehydrogenase